MSRIPPSLKTSTAEPLTHKTTTCLSSTSEYVHSHAVSEFCLQNTPHCDSVRPDKASLLPYRMSRRETQLWQQLKTWEQELQVQLTFGSCCAARILIPDRFGRGRDTDISRREETGSLEFCASCSWFTSNLSISAHKNAELTSSATLDRNLQRSRKPFPPLVLLSCRSSWPPRFPRALTTPGVLWCARCIN